MTDTPFTSPLQRSPSLSQDGNASTLTRRSVVASLGAGLLAGVCGTPAFAQEAYPSRPVRFILPLSGGSSPDGFARYLAERMSASLKTPFIIELRPGANTIIGSQYVAKAEPDGYTILFGTASHTLNPGARLKLPYDSVKDFVPIARVGRTAGLALVVRHDFPAKTVAEFVALAKANPGKYNYAHAGVGNVAHIAGELFKKMAGIDLIPVPYTGSNFGADVLGGQLHSGMLAVAGAQSLVQAGQLRALALTGPKRTSSMPDVPTFQEVGYPDMDLVGWFGLWAPANTPRDRVNLLYREAEKALSTPEAAAFLDRLGMEPALINPDDFAKYVEMDIARQKRFLQMIGFQPN